MTNKKLDTFLKKAEEERCSCPFCKDPTLANTIEDFMKRKEAGEVSISLNYLFDHFLVQELGAPKNQTALYNHVRRCLKREPKTGKPINAKKES
jgi:hypothetical protein